MDNTNSYSAVLKVRGVQPFLWMQFLNAFNDNVYKMAVSLLAVVLVADKGRGDTYVEFAGAVFIAPYLLFSAYAGQLADRFEKRTVIVITKAIEILAMTLALFALISGDVNWMMAVLFFTATQAAFFSPAKYGIVPELVEEKHITRANGLLEMSTFVAIILGAVGGSAAVQHWKHRPSLIGFALIGIAIAGTVTSLAIRRTPAPVAKRAFSWNPFGDVAKGLVELRRDQRLALAVLGTTFFWFLGALFQMILLMFGRDTLHATETGIGLLSMSLAVGIGIGSMAAGRLSGDRIEPGLVPIGACGMAIASGVLALFARTLMFALAALAVLGFMGGLFVVPLNAILQDRPAADEKGRILATANVVNTVGILLASGLIWLLHEAMHLSAAAVVGVSAVLTFAASIYALQLVPNFAARFVLALLTNLIYRIRVRGAENAPRRGAALLVANHVSFVDGFLIGASMRRFVRFLVFEEYYDRFRPVFRLFYAIRVPSKGRRAIVKSIELAREELVAGHVVCIFAEGALTLNGNIGEFHRGLEKIVEGLDVPVIPVHLGGVWGSIFSLDRTASIWRSLRKLPFPISVSFGAPMTQPSAFDVRQAVSELGADAASDAIAETETLAKRFVRTTKKNWSRRALTDSAGRTLTYGETLIASRLLADRIARDYAAEEKIGVMLPASVAAAIANVGITLAGRVPVNLNFTVGREALDSAIEQCCIRAVVTSKQFLAKAKMEQRPEMIFVEDLISFSKIAKVNGYVRARFLPVSRLAAGRVGATDVATILFSSGSSGAPKGVMLSHRNILSNTESVNALFQIDETDTIAGVLPFFHSFGFTYTLWFPLLNGATAAYHPNPLDAKGLGELVARTKVTFLPAAPTFCQAYVRSCTKEQFASLRHVLVGAERLSPTLAQSFEEKFGIPLLEGYGATEMSPVIAVNVPNRERAGVKHIGFRAGTVGRAIPGVAAKIVDPESGAVRTAGEEGLLLVKGPNRMIGYLNRPEQTAAVLRDGWYLAGDIVIMDDQGFIRIVDRQSRFSKIGGEMVPHGKVEEVLQTAAGGAACAVTSVADDRRGEKLVAFVAGASATPQEVWKQLMESELPKLWIPKPDDIRIVESLPMLGTGKVDLRALRNLAAA